MYVKTRMTTNPYTVSPDTSVVEAYELLRKHKIRRLPVLAKGKLIGIVTDRELQRVSPSTATSLSIFEVNYLLSKTKVKDAMTKGPLVTVNENALLEEAAVLMRENKIGALPVVDENNKLVGIITETNIFDAFTDLMGMRERGTRITVEAEDAPGRLSDVAKIISSFGVNISRIAVYSGSGSTSSIVIRINSLNTEEIEKALETNGYKIVHMLKNQS